MDRAVNAAAELQPVAARSEITVAADAVWSLFVAGVLPKQPETVKRAAAAAGLVINDLRDADLRRAQRRYVPPRPATPPNPNKGKTDEARARWQAGQRRGSAVASAKRSRQPRPGQTTMRCGKCGNDLHLLHFEERADRPGRRRTTCIECRREASRDRYLSVDKQKAMNAARLTFIVSDSDETLGLACIDCGELVRSGEEVTGVAQLAHVDCPTGHG